MNSRLLVILVTVFALTIFASAGESTCNVTYQLYDKDSEAYFINLHGEDNISYPPCNINIEAVVSCPTPFDGVVRMQLRSSDGKLVRAKTEKDVPYFLYGDFKGKIRSSQLLGKYTIQSTLDDRVTEPVRFTLFPCVPSYL